MDSVELVRSKVDLVALVSEYVPLRRAGNGMVGRCPFHEEKTASFRVSNGLYHCFGCKASGNAFSFLQKLEGLDFRGALETLAARTGVELQELTAPERAQREHARDVERRLREALDLAQENYRQNFEDAAQDPEHPLSDLLRDRGISLEVAREWGLGYADASWTALRDALVDRRVSPADAFAAGLLGQNKMGYYDHLRHRLTIPVHDQRGRVIGFTARILAVKRALPKGVVPEDPSKYMHTPETSLFKRSQLLFGLDKAAAILRRGEPAILVEGPLDVISMHRFGFTQTVAPFGTAFSESQAKLLARFTEGVVLMFDADAAGSRATLAAGDICRAARLDAFVVSMLALQGKDADELMTRARVGHDWIKHKERLPWLRWWIRRETAQRLPALPQRLDCFRACAEKIQQFAEAKDRAAYLHLARVELRLPKELVVDIQPEAAKPLLVDTSVFVPEVAEVAASAAEEPSTPPEVVEQVVDLLLRTPALLNSEECAQWIPRLSGAFARGLVEEARSQWTGSGAFNPSLLMALGPTEAARSWIASRLVADEESESSVPAELRVDESRALLRALMTNASVRPKPRAAAKTPAASPAVASEVSAVESSPVAAPSVPGALPPIKERPSRRRAPRDQPPPPVVEEEQSSE